MSTWFTLVRVKHIVLRAHFTWLLVLVLGTWSLWRLVLPTALPEGASPGLAAVAIMVLFVVSVLLHEGAHLLAARALHVPMPALNLYPIGAVARRGREEAGPTRAFLIAAAGPLVSLLAWWVLSRTVAEQPAGTATTIWEFAAWSNLMLALISLLPCLPLDGGRLLRAVLWHLHGNFAQATQFTTRLNYVVSGLVLLAGLVAFPTPETSLRGLWMILLAWLIYDSGTALARRRTVGKLFNRLTAQDVMTPVTATVAPSTVLGDLVADWRGRSGENATAVVSDGMMLGMIARSLVSDIPQGYWGERTAGDAMIPTPRMTTVSPDQSLAEILPHLNVDALDPLPLFVVDGDRLVGQIEQHEVLPLLEVQETLGLDQPAQAPVRASMDEPSTKTVAPAGSH